MTTDRVPAAGALRRRRSVVPPLVLAALSGCAANPSPAAPEPLPAPTPAAPAAREDPAVGWQALAGDLARRHEGHRMTDLARRTLSHRRLWEALAPLADPARGLVLEEIGRSVEGRPIRAVRIGEGPVRVVMWSQMHGNEPTATLALADLVHFVSSRPADPLVRRLAERLTVIAIPMLNPDGAQRFRRENASGVDVNRDARWQATPEARALAAVHARWSPRFGFNLHDQAPRVGEDGREVAISLLAPPHDPGGSDGETRTAAMRVAALLRVVADSLVDGRVTRYGEEYNPHAFGEAMQSWGTSTVLVETGTWDGDPDKEYLRRVNFVLLLTALDAIATGSYAHADLEAYESLPESRQPPRRR